MVPVLKLGDILLASIQTEITDEAALDFQARILGQVNESHARGIVIDITTLDVVDSYMARILNETANMASLLGARVVLTGMQPAVALTLVEMGCELIGVDTAMSLDKGVEKLQQLTALRPDGAAPGGGGNDIEPS